MTSNFSSHTAQWVCAARMTDGTVITVAGVEHRTVGPDGLIIDLRNEFTRLSG
ncbi:hypothetical protein OH768_00690 [Streptomyces sp. NBC_01622]|uniref:hypothetical protein n=1 Tax=Streptomyces sp. NBC_01622 TaxID=2975903 RepID=UPI0038680EEB|nr:hypothetical protein OH768_00690 [Streptomyces sp. NBC_01622]